VLFRSERSAAAARRRTRIVAGLGVVFLALFAVAAAEAVTARRNEARAQQAFEAARRASQKADNAADSTRRALAEVDSQRARALALADSIKSTNQTLSLTNQKMLTAQDSVRLTQRKALVEAEVADQYLRMSGQLRSWRAAADTAYAATVRRTIDSAKSIRAEARGRSDSLAKLLANVLCVSTLGKGRIGDTATDVRVRNALRQQLESSRLLGRDSLCATNTSRPRADARQP